MNQDSTAVFGRSTDILQNEVAAWKQQVEKRLWEVFRVFPKQLPTTTPEVRTAVRLFREFTLRAASKRIRAYLVRVGYATARPAIPSALVDVAAAVELIQTYLLIHDDIIDRDEVRRGGPTVHAALRHSLSGPRAERRRLSNSLALLIGDLAFSWAMRLVVESRFPAERRLKALGALLETHETCVGGQYLDVLPLTRKSFTRARVESIARRKTASYTFVGPLTAGAFLAGAPHSTLQSLSAYGESVGMAYQWIDDLDDVLSLRSGLASNDLDEGKGTAVVLATRRVLSARDRARFDRLLLTVPKTKVAVQELTRYVQAAQVEKLVRAEAAGFAKQGIQSLTQSKALRPEARNRLVELAHYILGFKTE